MSTLRVLYVGNYKASYPRNKIFIEGLRQAGVIVTECNVRGRRFPYVRLAFNLLRLRGTYDVILVGFPGQEVMFVTWLFATAPIALDIFTSHYMGYVLDRKYFSRGSMRAHIYRILDRWSCQLADCVLLDTNAHIEWFVREYSLPRNRFHRVLLGADSSRFRPLPPSSEQQFRVLFWGGFIPLQGTEYIIDAAARLQSENIRFILAGMGQTRERDMKRIGELGLSNIELPGRISDEELTDEVKRAHLCLGAFGGGVKTDCTIQNKIYEALASRRPLLTACTTALQELFENRNHLLCCGAADAEDLAAKIRLLYEDAALREHIADTGHRFFNERLTERHIGQELSDVLRNIVRT